MDDINALDGLRHELRDEVVGVKDQGLEHPCWWHCTSKLLSNASNTHVDLGYEDGNALEIWKMSEDYWLNEKFICVSCGDVEEKIQNL